MTSTAFYTSTFIASCPSTSTVSVWVRVLFYLRVRVLLFIRVQVLLVVRVRVLLVLRVRVLLFVWVRVLVWRTFNAVLFEMSKSQNNLKRAASSRWQFERSIYTKRARITISGRPVTTPLDDTLYWRANLYAHKNAVKIKQNSKLEYLKENKNE